MISETDARQFAQSWIAAWNAHDLDLILSHYGPNVALTSPTAAKILNDESGTINGKATLGDYFSRGLAAYPNLNFELLDVMWGLSSIVLYYVNQKGTKTGEFMELDADRMIVRVVANYNG
jgi:hypothetical protein